jgi:hypothetical protein
MSTITQTLNLDALIDKVVAKISEVLHAERSLLFLLDPIQAEEYFLEGLMAYRRRDFAKARLLFSEGAPSDRPCQIFLAHCLHLLEQPPSIDWDGVWIWDEKS